MSGNVLEHRRCCLAGSLSSGRITPLDVEALHYHRRGQCVQRD